MKLKLYLIALLWSIPLTFSASNNTSSDTSSDNWSDTTEHTDAQPSETLYRPLSKTRAFNNGRPVPPLEEQEGAQEHKDARGDQPLTVIIESGTSSTYSSPLTGVGDAGKPAFSPTSTPTPKPTSIPALPRSE